MADYRPGTRKKKIKPATEEGVQNKVAWLRIEIGEFQLLRFEKSTVAGPTEPGPTYLLRFDFNRTIRPATINLVRLTTSELESVKDFLAVVLEIIEPIIKDRDSHANEAADRGDDSFDRVYRAIPQLVVRPWTIREDNQGVHKRLESVSRKPWFRRLPNRRARGNGYLVADDEPSEGGVEDDGEETHKSS